MSGLPWFSLVVLGAGAWGIWRGLGPWLADRRFRRTARAAAGTITQMRWYLRRGARGSRTVGHPVLRFALDDGRVVETESYAGDSAGGAGEGDRVDVLYDPNDPTRARVSSPAAMEIGVWALSAGIGGLFVLIGLRGLISQLT
jgi:hypothetical protein